MAKIRLKKEGKIILASIAMLLVVFLLFFINFKSSSDRCQGLLINIENNNEQYLVTKSDIEKQVTKYGQDPVEGKVLEEINLHIIEKRVLGCPQIKSCEAYTDTKGNLIVNAIPFVPIARILPTNASISKYLDKEGNGFPLSNYHSPRVMILSGNFFNKYKSLKAEDKSDLLSFINYIINDEFWNAQIHQINIDENKEITLIPLLGNHIIEFGKAEKVEKKLEKLMIFYKQILPEKNWESFKKISVKFANQIVCE
jgi:cell division protein FtsQ